MPTYIAQHMITHDKKTFKKGEEVTGITGESLKRLIDSGAVAAVGKKAQADINERAAAEAEKAKAEAEANAKKEAEEKAKAEAKK